MKNLPYNNIVPFFQNKLEYVSNSIILLEKRKDIINKITSRGKSMHNSNKKAKTVQSRQAQQMRVQVQK